MVLSDLVIYLALATSSIVNIVVPISGSATVTPFLAILTDPHRAIGLASFYFLLSGIIKVYLFRKNIQWHEIKILLPLSLVAAFVGSVSLVAVESAFLLSIVLAFTIYFLLKRIKIHPQSKGDRRIKPYYTTGFIGLFSGFLQGSGLAGSDVRNSYLLSKNLDIVQLHGTTALIGASNFLLATTVRLYTDQLTFPDLIPLLYIFPFILVGTLLGRTVLYKFSEKTTNVIVALVMIVVIAFLFQKIFVSVF